VSGPAVASEPKARSESLPFSFAYAVGIVVVILVFLFGLGSPHGGVRQGPQSAAMQTARSIELAMFAYANDNNGSYPPGNSSTEVFQKLLDEGYINYSEIFYLPMVGKTKPVSGQKLKAENICFDVTGGIVASSPDELPVVFMTGYKVAYTSGGSAVPLAKSYPRFMIENAKQGFIDWLMNRPAIRSSAWGGFPVAYKSNSAKFMLLETSGPSAGTIPNVISPNFKPDGKTYRQLTPEGPLR
jgi:hypothetical protein